MVTVVVLGLFAFGAVTVGRRYLSGGATNAGSAAASDERVATLLHAGERSLDEGDLETAKEHFVKASALADRDPRVVTALAHVGEIRADLQWLRVKLVPSGDTDEGLARRSLEDATLRLDQALTAASEVAPSEPTVIRAKMTSLRVSGHADAARKLVADLASSSAQPETALSLASLDLAEASPNWVTVIERLRLATTAEKGLGRAHAMLVYALARSGDGAAAKSELERLLASPRPHPLAKPLQAFVLGSKSGDSVDISALPDPTAIPSDPEECIAQGNAARKKGDLARAAQLFQAALDKQPDDAPAATALAEVARAQGDSVRAMKLYEAVLAKNSRHVPALSGLADLAWDTGDRARATALYKQLIERTTDPTYTARASQRLNLGAAAASPPRAAPERATGPRDDGRVPDDYVYVPPDAPAQVEVPKPPDSPAEPAPTPSTAPVAPQPEPAPKAPAPPEAQPPVDTSDLPGLH
jgi:tetratricopeptide (TPR) repeat protein